MASVLELPSLVSAEQTGLAEDFDPEVDAFLKRYPFVLLVLKDAIGPLWEIFSGKRQGVSVYLETDPEVEDWEYLVFALRTPLPSDQAQAQLDAFGDAWWLENLPRAQGKLLFTLEFI